MDKKEFEVAMHRIAEAAPKEASPEVMSLIVANLVLLFEQQEQWPSIMFAATTVLSAAMKEDRERAEDKGEDIALRDANDFMAAIVQKRHLH